MNFVGNLGYVAICILGGYLAINGTITIGDIQAFIQYVRSFTQPISQIANISNILQQTMAAAERVFQFLAEPEEIPDTLTQFIWTQSKAEWISRMFTSDTAQIRSSSMTLPSTPNPARRSPSSALPGRENHHG